MSSMENFPNPLEKEGNTDIENAKTFDILYEIIGTMDMISGTQKAYTPKELITIIERVRHGHRDIEFVTRSYGIRDAVERLLESDKVYQKHVKGVRQKNRKFP